MEWTSHGKLRHPRLIGVRHDKASASGHAMPELSRRGISVAAISAVDIALWDIMGKSVGRPLWQLWGGVTDRVPVYGGGGFLSYTIDDLVKEAQATIAVGSRYYKMKIGAAPLPDIMENVKRVAAVRKAIGDGVTTSLTIPSIRVRRAETTVEIPSGGALASNPMFSRRCARSSCSLAARRANSCSRSRRKLKDTLPIGVKGAG